MAEKKHILIAEDELLIGLVLRKHLEKINLTVSTTKDKKSFYESIKQKKPDAIILDYFLKEDNGVDIANELRNSGNQTPIIFTTGGSLEIIQDKTKHISNSAILIKPVLFADILNHLVDFGIID